MLKAARCGLNSSSFIVQPSALILIPESLSPESACFLPNMETAVNLVQDGAPILGERVLVLGQGVIGLLTASLLNEFPLESLVTADRFELRRKALEISGQKSKVKSLSPDDLRLSTFDSFDLVYELSGSPSALNDAIELTAFSGRIVRRRSPERSAKRPAPRRSPRRCEPGPLRWSGSRRRPRYSRPPGQPRSARRPR